MASNLVVALSNSEGQTAGGTRERQQRRALATTPQGAGRVGVTKKAKAKQQFCELNLRYDYYYSVLQKFDRACSVYPYEG